MYYCCLTTVGFLPIKKWRLQHKRVWILPEPTVFQEGHLHGSFVKSIYKLRVRGRAPKEMNKYFRWNLYWVLQSQSSPRALHILHFAIFRNTASSLYRTLHLTFSSIYHLHHVSRLFLWTSAAQRRQQQQIAPTCASNLCLISAWSD